MDVLSRLVRAASAFCTFCDAAHSSGFVSGGEGLEQALRDRLEADLAEVAD